MAKGSRQLDWRWIWLGAAVAIVVVFFWVRALTRGKLQVRVVEVTRQAIEHTESTNGHVEPETNYERYSPLSTTVKAVYVHDGDQVSAGKVLLQLDDMDARARVASAESGVKAAQAALDAATHNGTLAEQQASAADLARERIELDQAQHDLDALTRLNASGAASASEVAAARQRVATATAALHATETSAHNHYSPVEVARAQAALHDAETALAAARDVESKTVVRAPIAGTIYQLNVKATDFVEQGKLLLQMADLNHEQVRAYFDEPSIGGLRVGQPIKIEWSAKPGKVWHGHIERVPITVSQYTTRNVGETIVKIDGDGGELLPDTNVTVTVTTSSEANALSAPREALRMENGKAFVFRVDGDELHRTPVTTGVMNVDQMAILSGLKTGDWVATGTTSGQPLQEGIPIEALK
ncbi:MAG TPA: efflux RND transporter periplasmic adaptor subunit [Terracidiphilus sp.]|nr:efflux RND transporter periplasmic adaptor subunit [Terracidiphilus sp.]